jgi:hypothetical protein
MIHGLALNLLSRSVRGFTVVEDWIVGAVLTGVVLWVGFQVYAVSQIERRLR